VLQCVDWAKKLRFARWLIVEKQETILISYFTQIGANFTAVIE